MGRKIQNQADLNRQARDLAALKARNDARDARDAAARAARAAREDDAR